MKESVNNIKKLEKIWMMKMKIGKNKYINKE